VIREMGSALATYVRSLAACWRWVPSTAREHQYQETTRTKSEREDGVFIVADPQFSSRRCGRFDGRVSESQTTWPR
jgi:hypothetical protein